MSADKQTTTSRTMDKEEDNIDECANAFVSDIVELAALNLGELMQSINRWDAEECAMSEDDRNESSYGCLTQQKVQKHLKKFFAMRKVFAEHREDVLEDIDDTIQRSSSAMSNESVMTYSSSWVSNPDSHISEEVPCNAQDLNEVIRKVCQSFVDPEYMNEEEEYFGDREEILNTEAGCSPIKSEETERLASSASSSPSIAELQSTESASKTKRLFNRLKSALKSNFSKKWTKRVSPLELVVKGEDTTKKEMTDFTSPTTTTTTAITEAARMVVSQVIEEAVRTLQVTEAEKTLQTLEAVRELQSTESASKTKKPAGKRLFKRLKSRWKSNFSKKWTKSLKQVSVKASSKLDLTTTLVEEGQDTTKKEMTNFTSSTTTTTTAITEAARMIVSQVIEEAVRTLQVTEAEKTLQTLEAVGKLQSTESASKTKKPAGKRLFKRLKSRWKSNFSKKWTKSPSLKKVPASCKLDLTSTPLELVEKEEGTTKMETKNFTSPASTTQSQTSMAQTIQVLPIKVMEEYVPTDAGGQNTESPLRPAEADKDQVIEIYLPPGPLEEDGLGIFSQEEKEGAEQQLIISPIIRRFFENLTDEQWREVSEGVYNQGVKEQLIDMCTDLLKTISELVIKIVLQSLRQSSATSATFNPTSPMSLEHLMEIFNIYIQSGLEGSLSKAFCDIIGADIPVRILPEFTEATMNEVLEEVNSVLSVTIQASLDRGSSNATAPASCPFLKERVAKKTLAGAISTMKSFLTGRATTVKRRIMAQKDLEPYNTEETPATARSTESKESLWRCFSGRHRAKIHPIEGPPQAEATSDELIEEESTSSQSQSKDSSDEETTTQISASQCLGVKTKEAKMRKLQDEKQQAQKEKKPRAKWFSRLIGLFCHPCCCFCEK